MPNEAREAVARAIADADGEDYMEDYRRYDKRADAAIAAYEAAKPAGEVVGYVTAEALKLMRAAKPGWHYHLFAKDRSDDSATEPLYAALAASPVPSEWNAAIEAAAKIADQEVFDEHALAQATEHGRGSHATALEIASTIRALAHREPTNGR